LSFGPGLSGRNITGNKQAQNIWPQNLQGSLFALVAGSLPQKGPARGVHATAFD